MNDDTRHTDAPTIDRKTPIAELPALLTIDEFCAYTGSGRSLAYEFARRHGVRFGRLARIPREVVATGE
jgi:hypothetical protein